MNYFLSPFEPTTLVSRDRFGSAAPHQSAHLHSQAESGAYFYGILPEFRGGVQLYLFKLNGHTPSSQSRVYRVTKLLTDGVHCRESAGTGPIILKVVPKSVALAGQHGPINMRLSFPTPTIGMNKVVYKIVSVVANTVPALYLVCFLVLVYAPLITLSYTVALLFIDLL